MKRQALKIELLDDCVFSASSATEGGHESLDRVPGAALLGAAASALYAMLTSDEAFTVFHSGQLRFGDGLPWDDASIGWPAPRCWHYPKTEEICDGGFLKAVTLYNFAFEERPKPKDDDGKDKQLKQLRDGYVHADGRHSKPLHSLRLKTAINPDTGRANEGQLFGYDALHRGQVFISLLEADDELDEKLFQQVVGALQGEVLLGRSRSAEYGRAKITQISLPEMPMSGKAADSLTLWLLSDLALNDAHGQPTLQPDGASLGLPGTEIVWNRTFLRGRRYSPWNAARHGYDRERLVLEAGGVITLKLNGTDRNEAIAILEKGVGIYREAGLGRVWVDPPLLSGAKPQFKPHAQHEPKTGEVSEPAHPLVGWLKAAAGISWKQEAEQWAREFETLYLKTVESSRSLHGIPPHVAYGPSRSQWGTVLEKAKSATGNAVHQRLFDGDDAVIKPKGEGWDIEVKEGGRYLTLADWLKGQFAEKNTEPKRYAHFVQLVARRLQDDIANRRV